MAFIPIAEFRPDVSTLNSIYTDQLRNVLPANGSYIPMQAFSAITKSFPEQPLGAFAFRGTDGTTLIFAGTETKLFLLNNTSMEWDDLSQEGKKYAANIVSRWSFTAFGDYIIAVNANDNPQVFEFGKSNKFRDLGGNPPRAGTVKIWGDFVCLMQLPDNPNRVFWSGLNDAEFWTAGQKNCDFQDFPDGGLVQGSSEATNPLIFLQTAIYKGTFIPGSEIIFSFQKIHDKRGAKSSRSIAARGEYVFFADEGGFFQIDANGALEAIGFEKVDRTIFSRVNASNLSEIFGVIDPFYNRVYWAMDYQGTGILNEMYIYDWVLKSWTFASINVSAIMTIYATGYTLEGLDRVSPHIEDLPFSLDSKAWQGGAPILGAFSTDYKLGTFTGENMEALVTSQEIGATNGTIQRMNGCYPVIDTNEYFLAIGQRFRRSSQDQIAWGSEHEPSYNTGKVNCRSRSRFHTLRLRIDARKNWSFINGFDVEFSTAGTR